MIGLVLVSGADETKRVISLLIIALLVAALLVAAMTAWYWARTNPRRRFHSAVPSGSIGQDPNALPLRRPYESGLPPYDPSRPSPDRLREGPYGQSGGDAYGSRQPRDPYEQRGSNDPYGREPRLDTDQFGNTYAPDPRRRRSGQGSRRS